MKQKKVKLFQSLISLLLCFSMLVGTTFAWFTDTVVTGLNTIAAGNLDVELYHSNAAVNDEQVDSATKLFLDLQGGPILWEPGAVSYENLRIANEGDLALAYQLALTTAGENHVVDASGAEYGLSQILKVGVVEGGITATDRSGVVSSVESANWTTLADFVRSGSLLPEGAGESEKTWGVVIYWEPGENDNLWNLNNGKELDEGETLKIELGIKLIATQEQHESDAFGSDYDANAKTEFFPVFTGSGSVTAPVVPNDQNQVSSGVELVSGQVTASVPAGVQLAEGATELTLTITEMDQSGANITLSANEAMRSLDVHIEGVAEDNAVPMEIYIKEAAPKGLNMGNYKLYHVENDVSNQMALVASDAGFTAHNQFKYDPATGDITLYMATFSEVAMVADTTMAWEGEFDYNWYDADAAELTIANADQFAAFGAIVGGMNSKERDSFENKTVRLIADVNLGDAEAENNPNLIFYPIGYTNNTGSYDRTDGSVTSTVNFFEGTFDGQGHTIANFYQNTWEMFGDYNDGYSAGSNYYKDAMGLFGYVLNGTVKNLTVSNFSSDGEFTPTGVIAAYAVNSTFENIAITNCNPRVYNTGNGGIIGIAGNSNDQNTKIILKNITVDNTNKISALWGSYDVACGGLVGMFRGNADGGTGEIYFENCHVAAQIDVYNDVCGNYQYYAYRYAGMIIGSVRHNTTTVVDGVEKTVPNMAGISAEGCTVNYGDWNDYYYCEFEKNGHPSYAGDTDYKFSRVDKSELNFNEDDTVTCTHKHSDVEDNRAIYLPFHQLFTGYGWGVNSVGLKEYGGIYIEGVDLGKQEESVVKFAVKSDLPEFESGRTYYVGDLFTAKENPDNIDTKNVTVFVSPIGEDSTVTVEYVADTDDWTTGNLKFSGSGSAEVIITDYNFCKETKLTISINTVDKFKAKFDNDPETAGVQTAFLYRVGNANNVKLSSLFAELPETNINSANVEVTINAQNNSAASGEFKADTTNWLDGEIKFSGTGPVKVTLAGDSANAVELLLEVVDAVNTTSAASAKANNVVLLNDVDLHTIEVSNGYTFYGNGFKMTAAYDVMYDAMNAGFVVLKNGTLDNVQIICPNFSYAIIYNSQIKDADNTAVPNDSSSAARGNVRSAVMADGNSRIINSYVHGGRAAVFLRSGNLLIEGSTISGGAAANIHTMSAQSLTLRNVTLIQKPFQATVHDTSKTIMGFSGLFECDENGNATPLILEGTLIQNAWADEGDKEFVPSAASMIVNSALTNEAYLHVVDGEESLNLGFAYIPQTSNGEITVNVTDNRTDKAAVPYETVEVGNSLAKAKVYSYKNTNGTSEEFIGDGEYSSSQQGTTAPTVTFTDANGDRVFETKFDSSDNRWESTLTVDLDNGSYTFSFDKLLVQKHGQNLDYTVKTEDGTVVDTAKAVSLTASSVTNYVLTVTDGDATHTVYFILTATKTSIPEPKVVDPPGGTPLLVVKSKNSDWSCAIPALEGIKIEYYDPNTSKKVTLDLATLTPTSTGKQNGTNNYWETTRDGYKLKVTCGYIHDTKQIYGMPVVVNNNGNKLYFTISSTNGYVSINTSGRTVTLTYEFTDPNSKTLTFTKTWQFNYADYKDKAQYKYSDFVNGTLNDLLNQTEDDDDGGCVTGDTLVTLADGTKKEIQHVTPDDQLLVWDFFKGEYTAVPSALIVNHGYGNWTVIKLTFEDGTEVKAITAHSFFDADTNKWELLNAENAENYIGHEFVQTDGDGYTKTKLVNVDVYDEYTESYSLVSALHYNFITENMFSLTNSVHDMLAGLVVGESMTYDSEIMESDIEKYGKYTYNDFAPYITEEQYIAFNGDYLKISVEKGYITFEAILALIEEYL